MKSLLSFLIAVLFAISSFAQYYETPDWFFNIPQGKENKLYSIGISDARMNDSLAHDLAVCRALQMGVIFREVEISYASDYFETDTEKHRTYIVRETYQEMGGFQAHAIIESFKEVEFEINNNGEAIVLLEIKFAETTSKQNEYQVNVEYFRQDFESSNTRSLESIRFINISSKGYLPNFPNIKNVNYRATNVNGTIVSETSGNDSMINQAGYFYHYSNTLSNDFNFTVFQTNADLKKGLWYAYTESVLTSMIKLSKNTGSKMLTVDDDFLEVESNNELENKNESLSRQVSKNTMFFVLQHLGIHNNQMYVSLRLPSSPLFYYAKEDLIVDDNVIEQEEPYSLKRKKKFFLWRWLCKEKYRN